MICDTRRPNRVRDRCCLASLYILWESENKRWSREENTRKHTQETAVVPLGSYLAASFSPLRYAGTPPHAMSYVPLSFRVQELSGIHITIRLALRATPRAPPLIYFFMRLQLAVYWMIRY